MKSDHEHPNDIYFMERASATLRSFPKTMQNEDYKTIIKLMDEYLKTHCNHCIITDLIDIDPDTSKTIRYCGSCNLTFN